MAERICMTVHFLVFCVLSKSINGVHPPQIAYICITEKRDAKR